MFDVNNLLYLNGRLTRNIYPEHYELHIIPDCDKFEKFIGSVKITTNFTNGIPNKFALHSKELNITKITIDSIKVEQYEFDKDNELLIIVPKFIQNTIQLENISVIYIEFNGILNDDLKGFYRSKYFVGGNEEKWIATTQFESTDARRAFPCFDEPNFKAVFNIKITCKKNFMVLSNMDSSQTIINNDNTHTIEFEPTPKMSTYLVAFIVGNFDNVRGVNKYGKIVNIYSVPTEINNIERMKFSLDIAIKCLNWYEDWFGPGLGYPLKKLDLVAIPDFSSGAMENWGLMTFRPEYLLCKNDSELSHKIDVVVTIAHEIAHQWFGNLVTMDWWTYLWLNESMATYYGWKVCDQLFPQWNVWQRFVNDEYQYALEVDALVTSHPIEFNESIIKKSKDIDQIFDGISYSKGSCLIRGLINQLGEENFKLGMRLYIHDNMYKNTTSEHLWQAFNLALKINKENIGDINTIMKTWTSQTGYPVVVAKLNNDKELTLSQKKYLKSGENKNDETLWSIYVTTNNDNISFQLDEKSKCFDNYIHKNNDTLCINPDRNGFYRVMYESDLLFDFNSLSQNMKKQILSDSFVLGLSGYQQLDVPFKFLDQIFKNDIMFIIDDLKSELVCSILSNLTIMLKILKKDKDEKTKLQNYINTKILPYVINKLNSIGYEDIDNESVDSVLIRPELIDFLTLLDYPDIINFAKTQFKNKKYRYILNIVSAHATQEEYEELLKLLKTEANYDPQLRNDLISSFESLRDQHILDDFIYNILVNYNVSVNNIRGQDISGIIAGLSANEYSSNKIWNFVKTYWNKSEILQENSSSTINIIKSIAVGFNSEQELEEYKKMFIKRPSGTDIVVNQMIEKIENRIRAKNIVVNFVQTNL